MDGKHFQNQLATGNLVLLVATIVSSLRWLFHTTGGTVPPAEGIGSLLPDSALLAHAGGWIVFLASAAALWILNVHHALIRTYSTFYLSCYLWLGSCFLLQAPQAGLWLMLCLVGACFFFFHAYQNTSPTGETCQGFFCVGLGTLFFPPLWLLVPFFFLLQGWLSTLHLRAFCAGLVGLVLPYWLLFACAVALQRMDIFCRPFRELADFQAISYVHLTPMQGIALGFVFACSIWSCAQYFRHSFQDKIRTRILLYYLMVVELLLFLLALAQPRHIPTLLCPLLALSSLLAGHYFAVTRSRNSLIALLATLAVLLTLFTLSLWMH